MLLSITMLSVGLLAGSIPFGLLISRTFYGVDLRRHGSGNIGAANAMRTIGKQGAAVILLLDALKGYLPVVCTIRIAMQSAVPADKVLLLAIGVAAAAVLGHCFTPWLGFRGGKGVATSLGVVMGLSWQAGAIGVLTYALVAKLTRISSLGSLSAVTVGAAVLYRTLGPLGGLYGLFSIALIVFTHRDNLARLRSGRELQLRAHVKGGSSEVPSGE